MTAKVEDFFITPLESHFESQPTEGGRETILVDMEPHTTEVLNDAVEWLKRNRQAQKTFPTPKECNRAVSAVMNDAKAIAVAKAFDATGGTYGDKLIRWVADGGRAYVIDKNRDVHQWREWEIYFLATENKVQYPIMLNRPQWTVPAPVPSALDRDYDWNKGSRLLEERDEFEREPAHVRQERVSRILANLQLGSDSVRKPDLAKEAAFQSKVDARFNPEPIEANGIMVSHSLLRSLGRTGVKYSVGDQEGRND